MRAFRSKKSTFTKHWLAWSKPQKRLISAPAACESLVHFWDRFGFMFFNRALLSIFWRVFCGCLKKKQNGAPCVGRKLAIRPCQCMFREGRPSSSWLHFGSHFGAILGAKLATILLFGAPGRQNGLKKVDLKKWCFQEPLGPALRSDLATPREGF